MMKSKTAGILSLSLALTVISLSSILYDDKTNYLAHAIADAEVEVGADVEVSVGDKEKSEESQDKMEAKTKTKIEVMVSNGKADIKITSDGKLKTYMLETNSKADIIAKIRAETGMTEKEITSMWKYEEKDKKTHESDTKAEVKANAKLSTRIEAHQKAEMLKVKLENKMDQLDARVKAILMKVKAGAYLGNANADSSSSKAYTINLDGTATSQTKSNANMQANLFLESVVKKTNSVKYKVTGGQITVGSETYDVIFGKARASSTSNVKTGTSMIVLAEVMKPDGEVTTMKLLLKNDAKLQSHTEASSWNLKNTQSKISGEWALDATGQMSVAAA